MSKRIIIECPYCGYRIEKNLNEFYGDEIIYCEECEKDYVLSWEIDVKSRVRKVED